MCRECDRGQLYCPPPAPCRVQARREVKRRAHRRHRQSPEGLADHRDWQRAARARRRAVACVGDPGTEELARCASVPAVGGARSSTEELDDVAGERPSDEEIE